MPNDTHTRARTFYNTLISRFDRIDHCIVLFDDYISLRSMFEEK